jgi:hypothetical protein
MAQTDKGQWLKAKLVSSDSLVAIGVGVVNIVNEQTAVSDGNGEFKIMAKADDMLVFTSVNYEYKRRIIDEDDIRKGAIVVALVPKITQLDEVEVKHDISPETLGLVPPNQKRYTPAERSLYAARSGPVDIIVNALSGRTKMLKKIAVDEKKEIQLEKLTAMYPNEFYVDKLKIPVDYVRGFQYFAIDNKDVIAAVESKNKARVKFFLIKITPDYLALIKEQESADTEKK